MAMPINTKALCITNHFHYREIASGTLKTLIYQDNSECPLQQVYRATALTGAARKRTEWRANGSGASSGRA